MMWTNDLVKFAEATRTEFGHCPVDEIEADYDRITFRIGRVMYQYDYITEVISPLEK